MDIDLDAGLANGQVYSGNSPSISIACLPPFPSLSRLALNSRQSFLKVPIHVSANSLLDYDLVPDIQLPTDLDNPPSYQRLRASRSPATAGPSHQRPRLPATASRQRSLSLDPQSRGQSPSPRQQDMPRSCNGARQFRSPRSPASAGPSQQNSRPPARAPHLRHFSPDPSHDDESLASISGEGLIMGSLSRFVRTYSAIVLS